MIALVVLVVVLVLGVVAVRSAHIPVVRTLTGAAPLQADDEPEPEVRP